MASASRTNPKLLVFVNAGSINNRRIIMPFAEIERRGPRTDQREDWQVI
jgi:hypothetical protein